MLLSYFVAFMPCLALVAAAPYCGLVPPKTVTRAVTTTNITDDVVAAAWYPGWRSTIFPPSKLSWSKYNVVTFAFAVTTPDINSLYMPDNSSLADFVTQAKGNNVKALISIGGWTGSQYFSSHVGDAQNRTAFVNTCYKLLTDNNLDGLDFDWEYPGTQGMGCNAVSENDSANFILFLSELRTKMGPDYMITLAVSILPFAVGDPTAPSRMTDVSEVANYVDHIAIMAYDINGPYASPEKVGANAPLDDSCADIKSGSATSAVAAWTAAKFPVDKIVLGVPAYGHSFNVPVANALVNDKIALYSTFIHPTPFGDGETAADFGNNKNDACGNPTLPGGVFDFEALISAGFLSAGGSPMTDIWYTMDNCSHTPFLYNKTSEVMVSFDDATSFNSKGQFINDNKLKGFAIWDATGDYNDILLDSISGAMGIESVCS